jgi:S-adenosylmethionine:tRNA ribosyltransferase-isomerase
MTAVAERGGLAFALEAGNEAHEPPEARGLRRDEVRLLVSVGRDETKDARFRELGNFLDPGDLIVVNTSATIPAALDGLLPGGEPVVVHLSGALPGAVWLVEPRTPSDGATSPLRLERPADVELLGGGRVRLLTPFADSQRLWLATLDLDRPALQYANEHGRPIRYRYVPCDWPVASYQTVFSSEPGSAEMPSAARPFTPQIVTGLVTKGVGVAPLLLHTGVSSLEGSERPYPERYRVPSSTAAAINATHHNGGRVIAVGTTVVRALGTVTDRAGVVHPGEGWTELVVTPDDPVSSIDGLLTGWHEPASSHLMMLEAFADRETLGRAYASALELGYLWHEFGDAHLIVQDGKRR